MVRLRSSIAATCITLTLCTALAPECPAFAAPSVDELMTQRDQLEEEIEAQDETLINTMAEISLLEASIEENRQSIRDAEYDLEAAKASADSQKKQMELRMKYLYENGSDSLFTLLMASGDIGTFLNRLKYFREVERYDLDQISSYEATQEGITALMAELDTRKQKLDISKEDLENTKAVLDAQLKEGHKKLTETDRRLAQTRAEELAAEQQRQQLLQYTSYSRKPDTINTTREISQADNRKLPEEPPQFNSSTQASDLPAVSGGDGVAVINFAMQFVGNPYVWGGNSLTEGCDCSGFVVQVYKHFGVDLSGHRNSALLRSVGTEVPYEQIQPGDIVCYSGHVALYAGNGLIVEAQSSRAGITNNRSAACKQIITVRRIFT